MGRGPSPVTASVAPSAHAAPLESANASAPSPSASATFPASVSAPVAFVTPPHVTVQPPHVIGAAGGRAVPLASASVPASTVNRPMKVFAPESVSVAAPFLMSWAPISTLVPCTKS